MENPFVCTICGNTKCVPPSGMKQSPILIVGDKPGREETNKGKPFVGRTGDVLRMELARLGMDLHRMRIMNLWQHEPNNNPECLQYGLSQVVKEAKGRQAILLMGSDVVKLFCDQSVSKVCGLQVKSDYLSAPIIMACVNPATAFHTAIGELRLAIFKFSKVLRYNDLL